MIKVVTGVRRCGKSTLFELYIERLKADGVTDEQIVFVNLEDEDSATLLDYKTELLTVHLPTASIWREFIILF